jgi:uncharacterized protein with PIN domain
LSLLAVLDLSAVNAYVRDEVTAVAPQELVAELADQAEPGLPSVLVASETYDAVLQQLADERDEAATRRLASLVDLRQVGVANLLEEQQQFAEVAAKAYGALLGSAAAWVLTLDVRGVLATYEPEAALQLLPGSQINDLGQRGDEPAW